MRRECIEELVHGNREIEFKYGGSRYSITYPKIEGKKKICVTKFYGNPVYVDSADAALKTKIGGRTLEDIFSKLPDSAFDIY